ncbi:hypothetical protein H8M03_08270 [Sphingomonas sabuli]|uniref:Uncharacterized protein n=1 Tax=Sphingomonas sabuli TaxID=2764186 RepID=A0A7G9L079_9SPHN|nr:hypothetical protein [Sphingomonas sabuli]QNM82028.1 hypothetical protein H8M03_08270 [Sphingomonas sabuli]
MAASALTPGGDYLLNAACQHFNRHFQNPELKFTEKFAANIDWRPSLHFRTPSHSIVAAQIGEAVFPEILRRRRGSLMRSALPLTVFCVCPLEEYQNNPEEAEDLRDNGFGLITISANGGCQLQYDAVPLQHIIQLEEVELEFDGLPKKLRQRLADSYRAYSGDPLAGVRDVTEVFEEIINKAAATARRKGWITATQEAQGLANVLQTMENRPPMNQKRQTIAAARGFTHKYRNFNHHPPAEARARARRFRECRHAFLEGLKQIRDFREDMAEVGLKFRY